MRDRARLHVGGIRELEDSGLKGAAVRHAHSADTEGWAGGTPALPSGHIRKMLVQVGI